MGAYKFELIIDGISEEQSDRLLDSFLSIASLVFASRVDGSVLPFDTEVGDGTGQMAEMQS